MRRAIIAVAVLSISSGAFAQGKAPDKEGALYETDTDAVKAPPRNTKLHRILKSGRIRACVRSDVPPFGYFRHGRLTGLDIKLAKEIAKQISIDYKKVLHVDWRVISADDRVKAVQKNLCDMVVATFSKTAARARQVGLSQVYAQANKVLLAATTITRKRPVIARVRGTTGNTGGVSGANRYFNTYREVLYAMDNGEVDYLVTDEPIATHMARSAAKPYKVSKVIAKNAENYAVGVSKKNGHLLKAIDKALRDLANTGRLALMYRKWL